jgi:hypothetical protein
VVSLNIGRGDECCIVTLSDFVRLNAIRDIRDATEENQEIIEGSNFLPA